jgi:hypothetical protein
VPSSGLPIGFLSFPFRFRTRDVYPTYTDPRRRGLYTSSGFIQTRRPVCPISPRVGPGSIDYRAVLQMDEPRRGESFRLQVQASALKT